MKPAEFSYYFGQQLGPLGVTDKNPLANLAFGVIPLSEREGSLLRVHNLLRGKEEVIGEPTQEESTFLLAFDAFLRVLPLYYAIGGPNLRLDHLGTMLFPEKPQGRVEAAELLGWLGDNISIHQEIKDRLGEKEIRIGSVDYQSTEALEYFFKCLNSGFGACESTTDFILYERQFNGERIPLFVFGTNYRKEAGNRVMLETVIQSYVEGWLGLVVAKKDPLANIQLKKTNAAINRLRKITGQIPIESFVLMLGIILAQKLGMDKFLAVKNNSQYWRNICSFEKKIKALLDMPDYDLMNKVVGMQPVEDGRIWDGLDFTDPSNDFIFGIPNEAFRSLKQRGQSLLEQFNNSEL